MTASLSEAELEFEFRFDGVSRFSTPTSRVLLVLPLSRGCFSSI